MSATVDGGTPVIRARLVLALSAISLVAACASQRTDRQIAYGNFEDGDYADTIAWIRRAESRGDVTPEVRAELTYLEARSLERMGERDEARELYNYLAERHPESKFGYLARSGLGGTVE